ncbi:helix-turn-helix transcriptional regulator [Saccharothrix xinjiangensis]|uniref:Helix-turn-helix domain-containing protein n=1 Tax=Saccharothrix xinjiangensis TaxID=204798 RepID=A0ABV9YAH1_9PSEU
MSDDEHSDTAEPAHTRLAHEIRRLRKKAGLSQPQLASKIGYTRQYVSLAERVDHNLPSADLIKAIDNALNAGGTLVKLREKSVIEQQELRTQSTARRTPGQPTAFKASTHDTAMCDATGFHTAGPLNNLGLNTSPQRRGEWTEPDRVERTSSAPIDGENFCGAETCSPSATTIASTMPAVQPSNVEELLMSAAEESSRFLTWAEATNVGELTVEQMHTEVRRIAHSYLKVPTLPLFARTKALRDRAFVLLSGHQDPRHTRELYAAAGWALTLLSWISVDLGRADAAEDHSRAAWMCAERADHNLLRAWVRATQHTASFWQADYSTAAHYAADGLNYTGTGTAELFLSSALALDLARGGDAEAAEDALRRAQRVAETSDRAVEELAGPLACSVDRAGSLWSDTELALGRAEGALALADRAVAQFEATSDERRNRGSERMARLQQVKAHLVLGDLRAAEQALRPVLDTPVDSRVRPLVHRVAEVDTLVVQAGWSADPAGRSIRGAVADFRRDTVSRELTA